MNWFLLEFLTNLQKGSLTVMFFSLKKKIHVVPRPLKWCVITWTKCPLLVRQDYVTWSGTPVFSNSTERNLFRGPIHAVSGARDFVNDSKLLGQFSIDSQKPSSYNDDEIHSWLSKRTAAIPAIGLHRSDKIFIYLVLP